MFVITGVSSVFGRGHISTSSSQEKRHVEGQSSPRDRLDERHRPRHRARARRRRRQRDAERLRRHGADRDAARRARRRNSASRSTTAAPTCRSRRRSRRWWRRRRAELGGVDILVNNAGIQHVAPVEEFPVERWDAVIAINLSAAFHAIHAALPQMKSAQLGPHHQHRLDPRPRRVGAEVGLRRGQARHPRPDEGRGARDRHHRHHLQRDLPRLGADAARAEADRRSGRAGTSRVERQRSNLLGEKQPSLEFATPEQIGAAALFLCSHAAAQIRGIALPVDGGWLSQ